MSTRALPRPIPLHRGTLAVWADAVGEAWRHWRAIRQQRREWRDAWQLQNELAALDPRTLVDIGAPQGLIGQTRWRDEAGLSDFSRLVDLRGG